MKEIKSRKNATESSKEKNAIFIRKMLKVVIVIYLIYRIGYGIGAFFAHLG